MDPLPKHIKKYLGSFNEKKCSKKVTRAYRCFQDQVSRCYNTNHESYRYYGGKGIRVRYSSRDFVSWWLHEYKSFKGKRPTISRVNHSKDYCFANIRLEDHSLNCTKILVEMEGRPWITAKCKSVALIDIKTKQVIKTFLHSQLAADALGLCRENIQVQCKHPRSRVWGQKTGFYFRYLEDLDIPG